MTTQITQTIAIQSSSQPPAIIIPDADLFARRADRFDQLADGRSWATGCASASSPVPSTRRCRRCRICRCPTPPRSPARTTTACRRCRRSHGCLRSRLARRAPADRRGRGTGRAGNGAPDIARLAALPSSASKRWPSVLHTELYGEDAALLPTSPPRCGCCGPASRASQPWHHAARRSGVCPRCGFPPVASVVRAGGAGDNAIANLRYLHCALCNVEWNLVRVRCAACDSTAGIATRNWRARRQAAKRRKWRSRRNLRKAAKLPEDRLSRKRRRRSGRRRSRHPRARHSVDEAGYARAGPNLLFVPGG